MQIEMIQEWIEKVRVGLDGAVEGGCGSGKKKRGLEECGNEMRGYEACGEGWQGSEEFAVISLKH